MPSPVTTIHGNITGPDGKPLAGVVVYNASRVRPVSIYPLGSGQPTIPMLFINLDGRTSQVVHLYTTRMPAAKATTDQNGGFDLRIDLMPSMLVVNDDHGFAKVRLEDFKTGGTIQLQPWAHRGDDQPEESQRDQFADVSCRLAGFPGTVCVPGDRVVQCADRCGRAFRVSARATGAGVGVHESDSERAGGFHRPFDILRVDAGQTASVAIADGRTVKGKFISPAGTNPIHAWRDAGHSTNCLLRAQVSETMPQPSNWMMMNPLEKAAYRDAWQQTPAAQSWNEALPQTPEVQPDGSFQFVGVKPGRYHLQMSQTEYDRNTGFGDDTASFAKDIDVPPDANGQPLDLGDLTIKIEPMLRPTSQPPRSRHHRSHPAARRFI